MNVLLSDVSLQSLQWYRTCAVRITDRHCKQINRVAQNMHTANDKYKMNCNDNMPPFMNELKSSLGNTVI